MSSKTWFSYLTQSPDVLASVLVFPCPEGNFTFPGAGREYNNREQAVKECLKALTKEGGSHDVVQDFLSVE